MTERRRRPTLRDIADETGLSSAAVSYALRGLQVPEETQQRGSARSADRLGYQADPIARALASGRTGNVGVLCGSLEDIWQQGVAAALGRGLLAGRRAGADRRCRQRPGSSRPRWRSGSSTSGSTPSSCCRSTRAATHWAAIAERTVAGLDRRRPARCRHRRPRSSSTTRPGSPTPCASWPTPGIGGSPCSPRWRRVRPIGRRRASSSQRVAPRAADRGDAAARPRTIWTAPARSPGPSSPMPTGRPRFLCLADSIAYGVYDAARRTRPGDPRRRVGARLRRPPGVAGAHPAAVDLPVAGGRPRRDVVDRTIRAIDEGKRSRRKVLMPTAQPRGSVAAPSLIVRA